MLARSPLLSFRKESHLRWCGLITAHSKCPFSSRVRQTRRPQSFSWLCRQTRGTEQQLASAGEAVLFLTWQGVSAQYLLQSRTKWAESDLFFPGLHQVLVEADKLGFVTEHVVSSLTKDGTWAPTVGTQSLSLGTTSKGPRLGFI